MPVGDRMHRRRHALAEHDGRLLPLRDVHQDPRLEKEALERGAVPRHRQLVAGPALDEVVDRAGQPATGEAAQIVDRDGAGQAAHTAQ